jgi:Leucine-rich repeat (LRR) protein
MSKNLLQKCIRTKTLALLLFFGCFSSYAQQYTAIPDSGFEGFLISNNIDTDGVVNGKVLTSDVASVGKLELNSNGGGPGDRKSSKKVAGPSSAPILNLTGIEDFSALTYLDCSGLGLTSLDVSQNVNLTYLDCRNNQLLNLDLSNNVALAFLNCGTNKFSSLDLSKNINLTDFYCYNWNNGLVNLNLKNGHNFKIKRDHIQLQNPSLFCILVDNVEYSTQNWTSRSAFTNFSVDPCVNLHTAIPDQNFEKALIAKGLDDVLDGKVLTSKIASITDLDVSLIVFDWNKIIYNLAGIQDFVALKTLNCSGNYLNEGLDLSKNTALTTLNCSSTISLQALDLSKNVALTTLNCSNNYYLRTLDLSNNVALTSLNCNHNLFNYFDISKNTALTTLDCSFMALDALDLSKNVALTSINCSSNRLVNLNLKNGNNVNIIPASLILTNNPSLTCIEVDANAVTTDWTNKDANAYFSTTACGAYTAIPDANFEQALIDQAIDVTPKDGKVLTSAIAGIKILDLDERNIGDLTGIQDFVALETLNCYDNNLTSLNVSKNTALTTLYCGYNGNLDRLDLTKNTALVNLSCNNINLRSNSLDVSKNTALIKLNCSNSNVGGLDVSQNTALTELLCGGNTMRSLDVAKNTALTFLDCKGNSISVLDVSKNTALTRLECDYNSIKSLDVSATIALTDLSCGFNKLTALDVSKNTALVSLVCNDNALLTLNLKNGNNSRLDVLEAANNSNLACILIDNVNNTLGGWYKDATASYSDNACANSYTAIPDPNFEQFLITEEIDTNTTIDGKVLTVDIDKIENLDLTGLNIADLRGIEGFTALKTLNITNNQNLSNFDLTHNVALTRLEGNSYNDNINALDLSKNVLLTDLILNEYHNIENLDVSKNVLLTNLDLQYLYELKSIDVSNNVLLTNFRLNDSSDIETLDVSNNIELTHLDLEYLNSLKSIDVSNNVLLINFRLKNSSNFETLDVSNNMKITHLELQNLDRLETIDVSNNVLLTNLALQGIDGIETLDVSNNVLLTNLNLSHTSNLKAIDVSENALLTDLNLVYAESIGSLDVSKNIALTSLNLGYSKMKTLDVSKNVALTYLNCYYNGMVNLNLKNGHNDKLLYFNAQSNNLSCILVDNAATAGGYPTWYEDYNATYSDVACAAYTLIPDANFEDKLISLGHDSGNKDGKALTSSIAAVVTLDASAAGITDFTGIQDFAALTALDVSGNYISSLDVSKNVALVSLDATVNQIGHIDFSKNSALKELDLANNKLIDLDLSNNKLVTDLYLENNSLVTLNLKNGKNTLLTNAGVDFTANPDLTCIQVDNIAYSTTNWSNKKDVAANYNLDCTTFTTIPDVNFENKLIALGIDTDKKSGKVLTERISSLTSLDVSNSNIADLAGIKDFVTLSTLTCNGNKLTALDVSKNVLLTSLSVNDNKLAALEVSKNVLLASLSANDNKLNALEVSKNVLLASLHANNNKLTALDLSGNGVLIAVFVENNSLTTLNLKNGNNSTITTGNISLTGNQLTCIRVDNPAFSDANWSNKKDAIAEFSTTDCSKLGIGDVETNTIAVYPNPTKGQLYIDNVVLEKATVYDVLGHVVKTASFKTGSNNNSVDLSSLAKGIYFIQLQSEGTATTKKIIVE